MGLRNTNFLKPTLYDMPILPLHLKLVWIRYEGGQSSATLWLKSQGAPRCRFLLDFSTGHPSN